MRCTIIDKNGTIAYHFAIFRPKTGLRNVVFSAILGQNMHFGTKKWLFWLILVKKSV
jgi:hypothetical protein